MLAAALTRQEAENRLRRFPGQASLAAVNGPEQVTLSGEPGVIDSIAHTLEGEGVWHRFLRVSHAFHSSAMDAAEEPLRRGLNGLASDPPRVRWISTVTGCDVKNGDLNVDYWWRNVRHCVRFEQAARAAMRNSEPVFLEIGPHPVVTSSLMECARSQQARIDVWPSLRNDAGCAETILGTLGGLFTRGASIDWNALLPGTGEPVDLPPHPWHRERHWHQNPELSAILLPRRFHPLLGFRRTSGVATWDQIMDPKVFSWLPDHQVNGSVVVPGAAYIELMVAALADLRGVETGSQAKTAGESFCLDNIQFQRALFLVGDSVPAVQVTVSSDNHTVSIHSRTGSADGAPWVRNAVADWSTCAAPRPGRIDLQTFRERCPEPVSIGETYAEFQRLGLNYGPLFQTGRVISKGGREALARVVIDPSLVRDLPSWWWHPTILDACFQISLLAAPPQIRDRLMLPVRADHIRIWDRAGGEVWCHVNLTYATEWAVVGDIHVYSDEGLPLAEISGFRCQRASGTASKREEQRGPKVYTTRWRPSPLSSDVAPRNGLALHSEAPAWIVFTDSHGVAESVAARLENRCVRVVRVARGTQFAGNAREGFQVNPAEPADIVRLLENLPEEIAKVGIAHFWSLDVSDPAVAAGRFDEDM